MRVTNSISYTFFVIYVMTLFPNKIFRRLCDCRQEKSQNIYKKKLITNGRAVFHPLINILLFLCFARNTPSCVHSNVRDMLYYKLVMAFVMFFKIVFTAGLDIKAKLKFQSPCQQVVGTTTKDLISQFLVSLTFL